MPTSSIGKAALIAREAVKTTAYLDSVGVWTIGVGHTAAAGAPIPVRGMKISVAEALSIFDRDIKKYERPVDEAFGSVKPALTDNEYDALVSFCYNVGPGYFSGKKQGAFAKAIIAGKRGKAVADLILRYTKPVEVTSRRQGEADQFMTPYSTALPKARRTDRQRVKVNVPARFENATTLAPPIAQAPLASTTVAGKLGQLFSWMKGYKAPNVTVAHEMPAGFKGDTLVGNIQAELRAKGFPEVGKIDGWDGSDTQDALKNFIRFQGDTVSAKSSLLSLSQATLEYVREGKAKEADASRRYADVKAVAQNVPEVFAPIKALTKIGLTTIAGGTGFTGIQATLDSSKSTLDSVKAAADTAKQTAETAQQALETAQPALAFSLKVMGYINAYPGLILAGVGVVCLIFVAGQIAPVIQLFRTRRIN